MYREIGKGIKIDMMRLKGRLKDIRERKGISFEDIGGYLGISRSHAWQLEERDDLKISIEHLASLMVLYKLPFDALVPIEDEAYHKAMFGEFRGTLDMKRAIKELAETNKKLRAELDECRSKLNQVA